jgi:hypothetical protein
MVIALRLWEQKTLRPSVNRSKGRDLQVAIPVIRALQKKNRQEASDRIRTCKEKDKLDSKPANNNNNNNNKRFNFLRSK